jgi:hypothetical protein
MRGRRADTAICAVMHFVPHYPVPFFSQIAFVFDLPLRNLSLVGRNWAAKGARDNAIGSFNDGCITSLLICIEYLGFTSGMTIDNLMRGRCRIAPVQPALCGLRCGCWEKLARAEL